jgi:hypothetical protein
MSPQSISTITAVILSLAFSYIPGLSAWYKLLHGTQKRLLMLCLLVLVAGGAFGLACAGWGEDFGLKLTCDQPGAITLLQSLVLALAANQSTYLITPKIPSKT